MDSTEVEENVISLGEPKLHGGMCKTLCAIYAKLLGIFPDLEAARPRSTSGIQALCALHIALEKTKTILQHCAECSKLYLAITGDSIVLKFEKARNALEDSLKRVEDIVPQNMGSQISEILTELQGIEFSLDSIEKQVGEDVISLLQQNINFTSNCSDSNELESFHQAAIKLGITSSRAALRERRALKKLIERARAEEDKRKESIVAYLFHLMRKYSKLFRSEFSDDNDSHGSGSGSNPCSPTVHGSSENSGNAPFDRQLSKLNSFNFKPNYRRSDPTVVIPPEELRCPISLQLMYDPVIIASGQTFERVCIEKWFSDGHNTCPKSQQQLSHLCLTPNYCVKGLVFNWCEQNGFSVPEGPPESLDLNYWRLALSESDLAKSTDRIGPCKIVPLEDSCTIDEAEGRFEGFSAIFDMKEDLRKKTRLVKEIRRLLKDDEEARIYMGENGFVEALVQYLECAVHEQNEPAQEIGAMALFNLAVNNNRNKEMMLATGVLPVLENMIANSHSIGAVTALYLNLTCLEEAKLIIGSSPAVPFLIRILDHEPESQCKLDALHTLYNLSSHPTNIPQFLSSGIVEILRELITNSGENENENSGEYTEKCIAILINLCATRLGRDEVISAPGLVNGLATILDTGEPIEQEQAVACLLIICSGDEQCSQMVLQEGVIPSLVGISVDGTLRGRQKAQKLLMLFREQRQRDPSPSAEGDGDDTKPFSKSASSKRLGRAWSFWRKNKSFSSVYQC